MRRKSFMIIAGEASGDTLAAELVRELRSALTDAEAAPTMDYQPLHASLEPRFFGAGGPRMAAAGVELALDMTAHSIVGLPTPRELLKFQGFMRQLVSLAVERQPDAIVCVDFSGFNRRFAHVIRERVRAQTDWFHDWNPKLIQYVSPQIWASREGRAYQVARDYDLVLSIFPFEKEWYAKRVPQLPVVFVGNPLIDRYLSAKDNAVDMESRARDIGRSPDILLLPGSRRSELARHVPVMIRALALVRASLPELRARMVLPEQRLVHQAKAFGLPAYLEIQVGEMAEALASADIAISKTGTITMECAFFRLPTVALYKTSWAKFQVAKRLVKVKSLAMPNILADETLIPEFIQNDATPESIAAAVLEIARDPERCARIKAKLGEIVAGLGGPGASQRAAREIVRLMEPGGAVPRFSEDPRLLASSPTAS